MSEIIRLFCVNALHRANPISTLFERKTEMSKVVYGHKVNASGHVCKRLTRIWRVFGDDIARLVEANEMTIGNSALTERFIDLEFYED